MPSSCRAGGAWNYAVAEPITQIRAGLGTRRRGPRMVVTNPRQALRSSWVDELRRRRCRGAAQKNSGSAVIRSDPLSFRRSMLGLPPAATPAPTARMAMVPAMTAATHVLRHELRLGDVAKHLAAHRRRQRRRRTGQAEARREYQCDHDRAHSILLGFRSGPQNGPLSLGLQFNQDRRQDARSIFRGQQRRIHVLFRCAHHHDRLWPAADPCDTIRCFSYNAAHVPERGNEGSASGPLGLAVQHTMLGCHGRLCACRLGLLAAIVVLTSSAGAATAQSPEHPRLHTNEAYVEDVTRATTLAIGDRDGGLCFRPRQPSGPGEGLSD